MDSVSYLSVARLLARALLIKGPLYAVCDAADRPILLAGSPNDGHPAAQLWQGAETTCRVIAGLTTLQREGLLLLDQAGEPGTTRLRLRAEVAGAMG